jgi:hypothetical protein
LYKLVGVVKIGGGQWIPSDFLKDKIFCPSSFGDTQKHHHFGEGAWRHTFIPARVGKKIEREIWSTNWTFFGAIFRTEGFFIFL